MLSLIFMKDWQHSSQLVDIWYCVVCYLGGHILYMLRPTGRSNRDEASYEIPVLLTWSSVANKYTT